MTAGYASHAPAYHIAGWQPFPLPHGQKEPPPPGVTGSTGRVPTEADLSAWAIADPTASIGIRMPVGVLGIDVDEYEDKHGAATLAQLETDLGALPATWSSTARGTGQPSRILFFRIPPNATFPGVLGADIEAIQFHHRYAVVAPSIHPKTGSRYRWYEPNGVVATRPPRVSELPELPAAWVTAFELTKPEAPAPSPRKPTADTDSIAERINADHDWHTVLADDGWQSGKSTSTETVYTRPGKDPRLGISAILHEPDGPLVVFSSSVPELQQAWAENDSRTAWSYSMFGYLAATRFRGDRSGCARDARHQANAAMWTAVTRTTATAVLNGESPGTDAGSIVQPYTDMGNARRLIVAHGDDLRHAPQWGTWLVWDGHRWAENFTGEVHRRAKNVVDSMLTEIATITDDDARKKLFGHWTRSQGSPRLDAIVHVAKTEPGISVTVDELDADPWILNTTSGVVALRTGCLTSADRRELVTKLAPVTFDPAATCPTWEWFVDWAMQGDTDLIGFLQRAVGYSLTGSVGEQCLFFLHGSGANGKSTFLNVLQRLFGDYAASAEPDLLLATTHERHPAGIADLLGRRLVVVQETGEGRRLAEATVKQLTGGDMIRARRMRENFFEFHPTHKLWMAANHRPAVRGTDHAIWRRIRMIPFTAAVAPDDQDDALGARLEAELPGILQWALRGLAEWRLGGLRPPAAVTTATNEYRTEQDHVGRFLDECCALDPSLSITAGALRTAYEAWCAENGERPWSAKAMAPHLAERGLVIERTKSTRMWRGLALDGQAADEYRTRLDGGDWSKRASGERSENASQASFQPQNLTVTPGDTSPGSPHSAGAEDTHREEASETSPSVTDAEFEGLF